MSVVMTSLLIFIGAGLGGYVGYCLGRRRSHEPSPAVRPTLSTLQEARMDAVNAFVAGMAHDFNNLLTAINGHAQLASEHPNLPTDIQANMHSIVRAGDRAANLIQQFLEAGHPKPPTASQVATTSFLTRALPRLRATVAPEVDLVLEREDVLPPVLADPTQLEQLLTCLVRRGTRAITSEPGRTQPGRIVIAVAEAGRAAVANGPDTAPRFLRLSVRDNGPALDDATLERLFEPNFGSRATARPADLDLAIVWNAVKQAGGSIRATSDPHTGTELAIYWPVSANGAADRAEYMPPAHDGENVLVLEDDPGLRGLITTTLLQLGYRIVTVRSSWEALTMLRERRTSIDLVICELVQPGLGAKQLTEEAQRIRPGQPVLVLTDVTAPAWPNPSGDGLGLLLVPFTAVQLAQTVRLLLDSTRPLPLPLPRA